MTAQGASPGDWHETRVCAMWNGTKAPSLTMKPNTREHAQMMQTSLLPQRVYFKTWPFVRTTLTEQAARSPFSSDSPEAAWQRDSENSQPLVAEDTTQSQGEAGGARDRARWGEEWTCFLTKPNVTPTLSPHFILRWLGRREKGFLLGGASVERSL